MTTGDPTPPAGPAPVSEQPLDLAPIERSYRQGALYADDVPALLAEVRRLRAANERLAAEWAEMHREMLAFNRDADDMEAERNAAAAALLAEGDRIADLEAALARSERAHAAEVAEQRTRADHIEGSLLDRIDNLKEIIANLRAALAEGNDA
jgi:chromosome segregation ATPase